MTTLRRDDWYDLTRTTNWTPKYVGDTLLGLLTQAQMRDAERHRRWEAALVTMALEHEGNRHVLRGWLDQWVPLGDAGIDAYCGAFPSGGEQAAADAKRSAAALRASLGI